MSSFLAKSLGACALAAIALGGGAAQERPSRLFTHQSYVEDVLHRSTLQIEDIKSVFAFVLGSLPERVKVYPTENYYYFRFVHNGAQYAGNIRLAENRDQGFVHFAYSIDFAEWKDEDKVFYRRFGAKDGVKVEKLAPLIYRVSLADRSVVFELNDLSGVAPPANALGPDERYIGPVFDESAVRFFLVYNTKLKLFHYVLDETAPPTDTFTPAAATDRILIGKRTGFAFYRDHRLERKILIGVFEGNARVNNYFDGPFDQLPDNFIEGESLRSAILEVEPSLKGKIDRYGASPTGETRFMISPYLHYGDEDELTLFHNCAESKEVPVDLYYACFLVEPEYLEGGAAAPQAKPERPKVKSPRPKKASGNR
ncbi:MAG: hypothetical protein ACRECO_05250 [Xanthobacteraceae bacterium]